MALLASLRSTIAYQTTGSTISTGAIYQTVSGGAPVWSNALVSSMVSIGTSTNQMYTTLSQGNFVSSVSTSSWVSSLTGRVSTTTVAMSANAQYQLALSQSSISTSVMFTSTLGSSWSTLSGATGLPNPNETSYTSGAISGNGQYGVLGTSAGQLFVTSTFGQTFNGPTTTAPYVYLPFEGSTADQSGSNRTVTATGIFTYGTGTVGLYSAFFNNTSGNNTASFNIAVPWPGAPNFTITGWFNATSFSSGGFTPTIFATYSNSIRATISNVGVLTVTIPSNGSQTTLATSSTLSTGTWYNYTFTFQTNGLCSFYLNNTLLNSVTNIGGMGANVMTPIYLGSNVSAQNPFIGYMDDVNIYMIAMPFTTLAASVTPVPTIYLPLDTVPVSGTTGGTTLTVTTTPNNPTSATSYVVGTGAVRLTNSTGGTATQHIRGTWTGSSSFTISVWANFATIGVAQILFSAEPGNVTIQTNNSSNLLFYTSNIGNITTSYAITANTWYNIVAIFQANGLCSFYVNNVLIGSAVSTTSFTPTSFSLGTYVLNTTLPFNGSIDDLRIYNSAVPIATQFLTLPLPPTIYLPLDTALTPTSTSQGSAPVTITTTGSPALSTTVFAVGTGSVNLVNTPTGTATQFIRGPWTAVPNFTVSFWCNPQSVANSMIIFSIGNTMQIQTNGTAGLQLNAPGISVSTTYAITTNTWYNITVIFQGNSICYFYVNNTLIAQRTSSGSIPAGNFSLGTYDSSTTNAYNGYIDDFRLYNTAIPFATLFPTLVSAPSIYLPLDTVPANGSTTMGILPTTLTVVGPPTLSSSSYVVGSGAVRFTNPTGGTATQYLRGPWTVPTAFTVSFWFNTQALISGGYQMIFCALSAGVQIFINNNQLLECGIPSGTGTGSIALVRPVTISTNTWYYVTLIYQANGTSSFYINNTLIENLATSTGLGTWTVTGLFGLGTYDSGTTLAFNGYIDDLKIYNAAIPFTPVYPSQSFTSTAVSNSGQYMLATMANQGLYMSSNFGSTWSQVTRALLSALWSNAQVSATGQYMLVNAAPVIVTPQLNGLTSNSWQVNGISWTATASISNTPAQGPFNAFSGSYSVAWVGALGAYRNGSPFDYTAGTYSTNIQGIGAIGGDWLQIQSSVPIVMYSYTWASSGFLQMPKNYYIIGSNDTVNWYPIQNVVGITNPLNTYNTACTTYIIVNNTRTQTVQGNIAGSFTTTAYSTSSNAYIYFRLVVTNVWGYENGNVNVGQWFINFQAGGQTYSTNYGATWSNQPALYSQQMLTNNIPSVQPQQSGLASNTWTQNNISWTASSSSNYPASNPYMLFNTVINSSTDNWAGNGSYNTTTGANPGNISTIIAAPLSQTITGEWFQLQSSVPLILQSYSYACLNQNGIGKIYYIVGSNDGSTWYPIQLATMTTNPFTAVGQNMTTTILVNFTGAQSMTAGQSGSVTTTPYSTSFNPYMYFRVIGNTVWPNAPGGLFEYQEFYMNFVGVLTPATIISPSTTLALSESGQYALSATVSNPVLLAELNFELSSPNQYDDSIAGGLTNPTATGTGITISSTAKVGTKSLSIVNTAGQSGSNSYVSYTLPTFFAGFPNAFTISAWINPSSLPGANTGAVPIHMGFVGVGGGKTLLQMVLYPSGIFSFEFFTTTTNLSTQLQITTFSTITLNVWTHVTGVIANGMAYVYINGVLQNSASYTGVPCIQTIGLAATTFVVGCVAGNYNQYAGLIDNVRIYNSALTPQQIQTIYANNVSSTTLTQIVPSFSVSPQQTGLTSNTWNQGGVAWTVSVSSNYDSNSKPYYLFNNTINVAGNDVWASVNGGYSGTPGTYNFSTTTTVSGLGAILGEWFQLQSSAPLVMYSYSYTCYNQVGIAKTYYIVGSNDGSTWFPIQLATFPGATNPFTFPGQSQSNFTLVNVNGTQTVTAGTSASLTTTTYSTTTTAYTYFRVIATQIFAGTIAGLFQYSEFAPIFTGPTNTSLYNVISPITNFSSGTSVTAGTVLGAVLGSAISNTGQYMALITNNTSGNNVYYSMNYGSTFTGLQLGTSVLTSCAISYDGSYITIASGATVYTLNNNSNGFSIAIGNQAGYQNQGQNAIAIGNYAGNYYQYNNSIILNASGSPLNSANQGFYVAPIASYTASSSQTFSLLGYGIGTGTDNQIVQSGVTFSSTQQTIYGEWIQYQLATPVSITSYVLQPRVQSPLYMRYPVAWTVVGSVDGINWTVLDSQSGQSYTLWGTSYVLRIASPVYSFIRIIFTQVNKIDAFDTNGVVDIGGFILSNSAGPIFGVYTGYTVLNAGLYNVLLYNSVPVCTITFSWVNSLTANSFGIGSDGVSGATFPAAMIATSNGYILGTHFLGFTYNLTGSNLEYSPPNYIATQGTATIVINPLIQTQDLTGNTRYQSSSLISLDVNGAARTQQLQFLDGSIQNTANQFQPAWGSFGQNWIQTSLVSGNYYVAISASGQYVSMINDITASTISISSNYGQTWTVIQPNTNGLESRQFRTMAVSGTGQYQVTSAVTGTFGTIYLSSNYGQTWTPIVFSTGLLGSVAISYTGQYLTAVPINASTYVYTSSNYGQSWTLIAVGINIYASGNAISISSTGQYQMIVSGNGIFTSSNYGQTWTRVQGAGDFNGCAISGTGQYQLTPLYAGGGYLSTNFGQSFSSITFPGTGTLRGATVSSTGQYMAVSNGPIIYYSTTYGTSWSSITIGGTPIIYTLAMSASGQYMVVGGTLAFMSVVPMITSGSISAGTFYTVTDRVATFNFTNARAIAAIAPACYLFSLTTSEVTTEAGAYVKAIIYICIESTGTIIQNILISTGVQINSYTAGSLSYNVGYGSISTTRVGGGGYVTVTLTRFA